MKIISRRGFLRGLLIVPVAGAVVGNILEDLGTRVLQDFEPELSDRIRIPKVWVHWDEILFKSSESFRIITTSFRGGRLRTSAGCPLELGDKRVLGNIGKDGRFLVGTFPRGSLITKIEIERVGNGSFTLNCSGGISSLKMEIDYI